MSRHYGHLIRVLHWCADQNMTHALEEMDLTAAQGHIMGYLAHRKTPPCPRDLEQHFNLSHPTVSGLLSRLEKKGFLELRADEADRRCKRIFILPRGRACLDTMHQTILSTEERLVTGFTPEEKAQFTTLLERAIDNMCPPNNHKHKEEPSE